MVLAEVLQRRGVEVELELCRLNGEKVAAKLLLPDETDALVLKTLVWEQRRAGKDATDVWRCLEIAIRATPDVARLKSGDAARARDIMERDFLP